jgi:hypothetical protein
VNRQLKTKNSELVSTSRYIFSLSFVQEKTLEVTEPIMEIDFLVYERLAKNGKKQSIIVYEQVSFRASDLESVISLLQGLSFLQNFLSIDAKATRNLNRQIASPDKKIVIAMTGSFRNDWVWLTVCCLPTAV